MPLDSKCFAKLTPEEMADLCSRLTHPLPTLEVVGLAAEAQLQKDSDLLDRSMVATDSDLQIALAQLLDQAEFMQGVLLDQNLLGSGSVRTRAVSETIGEAKVALACAKRTPPSDDSLEATLQKVARSLIALAGESGVVVVVGAQLLSGCRVVSGTNGSYTEGGPDINQLSDSVGSAIQSYMEQLPRLTIQSNGQDEPS